MRSGRRPSGKRAFCCVIAGPPAKRHGEPPAGGAKPLAHQVVEEAHMANYKILTEAEIKSEVEKLKDWSVKSPNIEASFTFKTFRDAISFIVQVAIEAEVLNHHPEFHNSYNNVSFSFCTHDAGFKITDLDIKTASRISAIAHRFLSMT